MQEIQRQPRNDRQEPCDNAKNDASHAQTRQEIQSKATLLFDRTNLTSESEWHRQDKTRLCHIHSNPSSQGDGQVLEKRNSCTNACMMRRFMLNSWQMPLATKPAQASRHATCHSTHDTNKFRPATLTLTATTTTGPTAVTTALAACELRCSMFTVSVKN